MPSFKKERDQLVVNKSGTRTELFLSNFIIDPDTGDDVAVNRPEWHNLIADVAVH